MSYTAKDIYVLEGLEPVRKRPGMYIGSTGVDGLHHLIWEVVDNSIDEAMAGYAKNIRVELLPDNKVAVSDDGRGIPVETHAQTKTSALETVMTKLHAGGKFGGESYKVSGGLHGVGVSVVNALSTHLEVEVCRDGNLYKQEYARGVPEYKVKKIGKSDKTGTKVTFEADPTIFPIIEYDLKRVVDHLRQQAYLTKGVKIEIIDKRKSEEAYYSFYFDGGLLSFINNLVTSEHRLQEIPFYIDKTQNEMGVEVAFAYSSDLDGRELSFANNIYTPDGGMHLTGFRSALTRVINDYARSSNYLKVNDDNLTGDDARESLFVIVSVKIREPQFEGQTKARLGNPEARTIVEVVVGEALKDFFERNSVDSRRIIEKVLLAAKARKAAKAAKETVLRKGALEGLALPGKLADCSTRNPAESELFIVEGDSAGGCFSGDTKVALVDGRNLSFEQLVNEYQNGIKNFCYTINSLGFVEIKEIESPRITKNNAEVIKIILDNGEGITCTPDHKFMLADGSYKRAKLLKNEDSLMPLYRQYSKIGRGITIEGYEMFFDPAKKHWLFTHVLADEYNLKNNIYSNEVGTHRHHVDFKKLNNNPPNIKRLTKEQHLTIHRELAEKTLNRPEVREKLRLLRQTPSFRKKVSLTMSSPEMKKMLSERAKKQWQDNEYKEFMSRKFIEFYNSNTEYRNRNSQNLNLAQKQYWSREENRKKQSKQTKSYFEAHPEKKIELRELSLKQWQDDQLKEWRKKKTSEQWTSEFREKRKNSYDKTYLQKALGVMKSIYENKGVIDIKEYEQVREKTNDKSLLKYKTILERFFNGNENKLFVSVQHFNHKVKEIIKVNELIDVYDLEVPGTHNFALASGVFVHNSAKMGRDRRTQAILPLFGKILNIEKARIDKMLTSDKIKTLIIALGTSIGDSFDLARLRYHKVVLMSDADVDGAHIRTLYLTLFYRHLNPIITNGHLYIAQPPLYRIQKGKDIQYAYNDIDKEKLVKTWPDANVQRYKGLGEMNAEQLWETTMNPANRVLKQVNVADAEEADKLFDILMGTEVEPRKHFIQARALSVKNLDV